MADVWQKAIEDAIAIDLESDGHSRPTAVSHNVNSLINRKYALKLDV